jgi:hypothetical protein
MHSSHLPLAFLLCPVLLTCVAVHPATHTPYGGRTIKCAQGNAHLHTCSHAYGIILRVLEKCVCINAPNFIGSTFSVRNLRSTKGTEQYGKKQAYYFRRKCPLRKPLMHTTSACPSF